MKLLLDSHTVIWSMDNPAKLSRSAVQAIENESNDRLISIGTVWELSIKVQLGKLAYFTSSVKSGCPRSSNSRVRRKDLPPNTTDFRQPPEGRVDT